MATVNFLYRSKRPNAPLTLRLLFRSKNIDYTLSTRTNEVIEKALFEKIYKKNPKDAQLRNSKADLTSTLNKIEQFIIQNFVSTDINRINKDWLTNQMKLYYTPKDDLIINKEIGYWIDKTVKDAQFRENSKGGLGLSKARINAYKRLKVLFNEFVETDYFEFDDLNEILLNDFRNWLIGVKTYQPNYSLKKVADLKSVSRFAYKHNVNVNRNVLEYKVPRVTIYDDDMDVIYLTETEIEQIERAELKSDAQRNARKWLIISCYTGQRAKTLVDKIIDTNFHKTPKGYQIKFKQGKGNKTVIIPVLPKVEKIFKDGLPYKIAPQNLNLYYKEICKIAEVDDLVMGRLRNEDGIYQKKLRPKYEYCSTHTGRRTFCCNHYGKIPTPKIMAITGHSKEETFKIYCNQVDDSHVDTFLDYYDKK